MDKFYIGQRLSYNHELCTVRYYGPVEGAAPGPWLGVEWDKETRGKHDGKSYFKTLSSSPTAASFIRPSRRQDTRRSFLQALRYKYAPESGDLQDDEYPLNGKNLSSGAPIEISGKVVEEIGFERIRRQQGVLHDLRIVLLDGLCLGGLVLGNSSLDAIAIAQEDVAQTCPNIRELDLGWNLLETWSEIADICRPLTQLRILKAGGLRLRSFELERSTEEHRPFEHIEELHLNDNLLCPEQIADLISSSLDKIQRYPRLRTLSLSQNSLLSLDLTNVGARAFEVPSLDTLVLENNLFTSLQPLKGIFSAFHRLKTLSLQGNRVARLGIDDSNQFHGLETLNLSHNLITSYEFVDRLPTLFPDLVSLRISNNPFFTSSMTSAVMASSASHDSRHPGLPPPQHTNMPNISTVTRTDTSYSLTLARIPNLKTLNYSNITARDREEGEIYYLIVAERDFLTNLVPQGHEAARATFIRRYARYEELCKKYTRNSIVADANDTASASITESSGGDYAAGTLGARLVTASFHIPPSSTTTTASSRTSPAPQSLTWTRELPPTVSVYTLKSLVTRHFGLPPLGFKLIYESEELDPIKEDPGGRRGKNSLQDWSDWGDWCLDHRECREAALKGSGQKWKKREVEIPDGTREWGYYLEDGVRKATVRIEPRIDGWVEEGRRVREFYGGKRSDDEGTGLHPWNGICVGEGAMKRA